jgi:secreted Zn-dependent insulinase-like peptidase
MQILLNYQSGNTLLADLTPEHYITDTKAVVSKLTAQNNWAYPIEAIMGTEFLELTDEEYAEIIAPWQSYIDFLAAEAVEKHLYSQKG